MILETKRLKIKEATLEDSPFILKLLNSPNWIEFIGNKWVKTDDDAQKYIQTKLLDSYQENGFGLFIMELKDQDKAIGLCGFIKRPFLDHADIGFGILPTYEGKGYTSEAAIACLNYGMNELKIDPILGITTKENQASQYLLKKLGLKKEKTLYSEEHKVEFLVFST